MDKHINTSSYLKGMRAVLILIIVFVSFQSSGQASKQNPPSYFGLFYRPILPIGIVGDKDFTITEQGFSTTISPKLGYSFGGTVRVGLTKLISLETGIGYTRRNYKLDFAVPDSNIVADNDFGIINFDVPINALIYIQLTEEIYMNTSLGVSALFNPSDIRTSINPEGKHVFIQEGRRRNHFTFEINANVGFEYRTKKDGFFYLGGFGKIPFGPIFQLAAEYRYDTESIVAFGDVEGATIGLELKYFFHNSKKKGVQFVDGPIEQ